MDQPKTTRDLTTGSILGNVLYMGVPSMVGFAAMVIYELTDMFWVARIGTAEVAAVTLFASFAWVLSSINSLVGSGSVAVISRRFGEKDLDGTVNAIRQTLVMKFLIGLPMGIAGFFVIGRVLALMTGDGDVVRLGVAYGRIFLVGLPFMFTSYTVYTAFRGIGDAPKAMYVMLFSTGLNMALDPLFIVKFNMGVEGAAIATIISAVCGVVVGLWMLRFRSGPVKIRFRGYRIDTSVMGRILKIGFPPFIESIARSVSFWLFAIFVAHYGTLVVASYGICLRIFEFGIVFAVGLELGASAIVGQNMGAGKPDRAGISARNAGLLALGLAVTLSTLEIVFGQQIMHVFGNSPEVKIRGAEVLMYFAIAQPFAATAIALSSAFFGSGNTWPPTIAGLLTSWTFQIPLTAIFVYVLGSTATVMWILMILANAIYLGMLVVWFRRGKWKEREV
ncbi:MAG: MATE family efflux transporter [Candidatus Eisenbacteria bacterium]